MSDDEQERQHHPDFDFVTLLQPEPKRLWLEALRSDRFQQGKSYLAQREGEGGVKHCCLGVLCEVAIEAGVEVERQARTVGGELAGYSYDGNMSMPPESVTDWAYGTEVGVYLAVIEEHPLDPDKAEVTTKSIEFVALNDDREWSFEQIADAIEESL